MRIRSKIAGIVSLVFLCAVTDSSAGDPAASSPSGRQPLNAKQVAEANARLVLANTIVDNVSADAQGKKLDASWRINLLSSLYNVDSASLRAISEAAHSVDMAHQLARSASDSEKGKGVVSKSLGSALSDLVFTPKTPCRFIDTRVTGGPISANTDYNTALYGNTYGGDATCTLPGSGEPALVANVTIVVPAGGGGFLGIRPYGATNTTSFINWTSAGAAEGLANAGVITTGLNSGHYDFEVFKGGTGNPQLILDYFGYFAPAAATALTCNNTFADQSIAASSAGNFYYSAACSSGTTATTPFCDSHTVTNVYLAGSGISSNAGFCEYKNLSGAAASAAIGVTCCYVP